MNAPVSVFPLALATPTSSSLIHADGLVIDKLSGEIIGYDDKPSLFDVAINYPQPIRSESSTALVQSGWLLDPIFDSDVTDESNDGLGEMLEDEEPEEEKPEKAGGGGRPPKMFHSQNARLIQTAFALGAPWIDDYVYAGCYVSSGSSNGTLNISPQALLRVCLSPLISTKVVRKNIMSKRGLPVSTRQAQRLVKAAIFAVGGMDHHLATHPEEASALLYEAEFADSYQGAPTLKTADVQNDSEASKSAPSELTPDTNEEPSAAVLRTEWKYTHDKSTSAKDGSPLSLDQLTIKYNAAPQTKPLLLPLHDSVRCRLCTKREDQEQSQSRSGPVAIPLLDRVSTVGWVSIPLVREPPFYIRR